MGFRRFVERAAWDLKISGYVENSNDGSVKIFVQGPIGSLDEFASKIKSAPPPIVIAKTESKKAKTIPSIKSFRIKTGSMALEMQEGFGAMETQFGDYRSEFRQFAGRTDENFNDYRSEFRQFAGRTDENFNNYRSEFRQFAGRTDENFKTLGDKYGEISAKLTQVLETLERESTETRKELTRAVDNLSSLVEHYIKSQHRHPRIRLDQENPGPPRR